MNGVRGRLLQALWGNQTRQMILFADKRNEAYPRKPIDATYETILVGLRQRLCLAIGSQSEMSDFGEQTLTDLQSRPIADNRFS